MRYTVTARAASLAAGVLGLTEVQAERRRHALAPLGEGRYRIVVPVEFKAGEVFDYEGDLPKAQADIVVDAVAAPKAPKRAARKAKA